MNPDILPSLRDIGLLTVGALLGFLGSFGMWKWQLRDQRREKKAEQILHAIHLAASSLTHIRCLLYSKIQGVGGVFDLPENPVDELLAIATLSLREIEPLVQQLHDKQQELFAFNREKPGAADLMLRLAGEVFPALVNEVMNELRKLYRAYGAEV
jgi:hypothetical protein